MQASWPLTGPLTSRAASCDWQSDRSNAGEPSIKLTPLPLTPLSLLLILQWIFAVNGTLNVFSLDPGAAFYNSTVWAGAYAGAIMAVLSVVRESLGLGLGQQCYSYAWQGPTAASCA